MKLNKILAIALMGVAMTACSDDDSDFNTASGVTVQMGSSEYSGRENGSIFTLPINVTGDANGQIIVYVETAPVGDNPAIAEQNYIVTSQRIIIPAGTTTGYVEIEPLDNDEENDTRSFSVTITKAEGATIGAQATTVVDLRDNDQDPYEKMTGAWKFTATNTSGAEVTYNLNMVTPDPEEDAEYYGHELYGNGMNGHDEMFLGFRNFEFNEITGEGTMELAVGDPASMYIWNFSDPIGQGLIFTASITPNGMSLSATYEVTFTSEYNEIVFPDGCGVAFAIMSYPSQQYTGYINGRWTNIKLVRP
ncbi:MAG: hypothetical protein NC043_01290 [Muribaculaceae bacterium]|nr:hypothetical protein [Muribaculaceae bacterium]